MWVRCVQEHDRLWGLGVDCRAAGGGGVGVLEQVSGVGV